MARTYKPLTVAELIAFLQTQPQDIPVIYTFCSDYEFLELDSVHVVHLCEAREDGWIQSARPDKPTVPYLLLPGN